MPDEIKNIDDFRRWVKLQVLMQNTTQEKVAQKIGIAPARISEALYGKPCGKRHIKSLIKELGGDMEDFKAVI